MPPEESLGLLCHVGLDGSREGTLAEPLVFLQKAVIQLVELPGFRHRLHALP